MWLCNRKFTTVGEVLTKPLTASQVSGDAGVDGIEHGGQSRDKNVISLLPVECKGLKNPR